MSMTRRLIFTFALSMLGLASATAAGAHGLAGKRFFPSTIAIDDPFVSDELTLPSILHIKRPASGDEPATRETEISGELSKRITRFFGISLEGELAHLDPDNAPSKTGFGNLEVGLKWQALTSEAHEALLSFGVGWEVGGTGRKATEAESFDVVTPSIFFGKGFGDLPDSLWILKPLALTGVTGLAIPTRSRTRTVTVDGDEVEEEIERHPHVLKWGFALEYSAGRGPAGVLSADDPAGRGRALDPAGPGTGRSHHRHGQPRDHLGRALLPGGRRGRRADQRADRQERRRPCDAALLPGRSLPDLVRTSALR
jgi:hypothetical protein